MSKKIVGQGIGGAFLNTSFVALLSARARGYKGAPPPPKPDALERKRRKEARAVQERAALQRQKQKVEA